MAQNSKKKPLLNARELSLEEWLAHVLVPEEDRTCRIQDYSFPTDRHLAEYLGSIRNRSDKEIKQLLREFLVPSGSLGSDDRLLQSLCAQSDERLTDLLETCEFVRRLFRGQPWEGITWVLDLLPSHPVKAIDALDAYFVAHCQFFPDGRAHGLSDAKAIIRQRYVHFANSREALEGLRPAEFELLMAALFDRMGYSIALTQASHDGGVDIVAERSESGARAVVLIQCKHSSGNVTVQTIRELTGVVLKRHANKGIVVASGDFTAPAKDEARATPTIELIGFPELNVLLNQHLGADWPESMSYHIRRMEGRRP